MEKHPVLFDAEKTTKQLKNVYEQGLQHSEPYWNFGYNRLTEAFPTLTNGLWYILGAENVGKSMMALNIAYQTMKCNPDCYWLDFSLDDGVEDRLGYLLACAGRVPIDLIHQAGNATSEEQAARVKAVREFKESYTSRYRLFGVSNDDEDENPFTAERICNLVQQARDQVGESKLLVTVDSFHDVELGARATDENDRLGQKSKLFNHTAKRANALFILTAHTRKDSRKRGMTPDAMWGTARLAYDAKIMSLLYSDVNLNREKATVYWLCPDFPNKLMPVLEMDVVKNKVGAYKDVIYFNYLAQRCQCYEVDDATSQYYRDCVYSKGTK